MPRIPSVPERAEGSSRQCALASQSSLNLTDDEAPTSREDARCKSLLKELRCEIKPADASKPCKARNFRYPPPGNEEVAWRECAGHVEAHDDDVCKALREEIDTLLVFAGLFSAIVTAFSIESYQWLLVTSSDTSAELLSQVVQLLSPSANSPLPPSQTGRSLPPSAVVRINAYWFLSLILSLSFALVGILCKQWVREFGRRPRTSGPELVGVRQTKYEGLQAWKVREIVAFLPILLQLALGIFVLGVLELLWRLHIAVAVVVTAATGVTLFFYLATTFMPAIQYLLLSTSRLRQCAIVQLQCPYKSPQALLALRLITALLRRDERSVSNDEESVISQAADSHPFDSWSLLDRQYDTACNAAVAHGQAKSHWRGLGWLLETSSDLDLRRSVWHCLWANTLRHCDPEERGRGALGTPGPRYILRSDPRASFTAWIVDATPRRTGNAFDGWWTATLLYPIATSFEDVTRLEIFIRGLAIWPDMPAHTAYQIMHAILPETSLATLSLKGLSGSLARSAISFFESSADKASISMGHFLYKVTACLSADTSESVEAHVALLCIAYARWLRACGTPSVDDVPSADETIISPMAALIIGRLRDHALFDPDGVEWLHSVPHVQELAEVLRQTTATYCYPISGHPRALEWRLFPRRLHATLRSHKLIYTELMSIAVNGAGEPATLATPRRSSRRRLTVRELGHRIQSRMERVTPKPKATKPYLGARRVRFSFPRHSYKAAKRSEADHTHLPLDRMIVDPESSRTNRDSTGYVPGQRMGDPREFQGSEAKLYGGSIPHDDECTLGTGGASTIRETVRLPLARPMQQPAGDPEVITVHHPRDAIEVQAEAAHSPDPNNQPSRDESSIIPSTSADLPDERIHPSTPTAPAGSTGITDGNAQIM